MLDEQEKTSKFLEAIQKAAMEKCTSLEEEFHRQLQEELKKAEEEASRRCHFLIDQEKEKIKAGTRRALAQHESEKRREISEKRLSLQQTVFANVRKALEQFLHSEEYPAFLRRSATELASRAEGEELVLYLRKQDLPYAAQLQSLFGGASSVQEDPGNALGGLKAAVPARKILFDNTLEARLEQEADWFIEHADLKII